MKLFPAFLALFGFQFSFAQTYHAFPDSNARWSSNSYYFWTDPGTWIDIYVYNGSLTSLSHDTTINSQKYVLVGTQSTWGYQTDFVTIADVYNHPINPPGQILGAIREDSSRKIWYISFVAYGPPWPPIDSEVVLYDFNLQVGQTITYPYPRTVVALGSIQLEDGSFHKKIIFSQNGDYWIEGVGSSLGLFGPFVYPNYIPNQGTQLNCFWQDGQYLFHKSILQSGFTCDSTTYIDGESWNGIKIIQSPGGILVSAGGLIQLNLDNDSPDIEVINSMGQIILQSHIHSTLIHLDISAYPSGLYYLIIRSGENKITVTKVVKI